jgi:hypothetical protein
VTYLRGKQDDRRQQDLWEYHVADGVNRLLVDSRALVPESREGSPGAHAHRWQRYCRIHLGAR